MFGVDLEFLLEREAPNGEVAPGAIPAVFLRLVKEVESRGLSEIGICKYLPGECTVCLAKTTQIASRALIPR